jgi:hypothetical protein
MRFLPYVLTTLVLSAPAFDVARAQSTDCGVTGISAEEAPPPLPDYDQPPVPGPGYVWTPGYWAWNNVDYYWVPGTWAQPPQSGLLWTPPYWGFADGAYVFHRGYWGQHVGFYGGVAYGYGYTGNGFEGGRWDHGAFYYNRSVTNLNGVQITNVYDRTVVVNNNTRVSYTGGSGVLTVRPTAADEAFAREPHVPPTRLQTEHLRAASVNGSGFASSNHGRPTIAATARPGEFNGPGATPARAGERPDHATGAPGQTPPVGMERPAATPVAPEHGEAAGRRPEAHGSAAGVPANPNPAAVPGEDRRPHEHAPGAMEGGPAMMRMNQNPHPRPAAHPGFSGGAAMHGPAHGAPAMREAPHEAMHAAPHGEAAMHAAHPPHPAGGGHHPDDKR